MPEAVFVCDGKDRVRIVNPAADRLFRGRPVRDASDLSTRFEALPKDQHATDEGAPLRLRHLPGREYHLRSFPIERQASGTGRQADGGGRILVLRDVTAARVERAERTAFLSILSHELRTPITTIYAGSRVLARREARSAPRGSTEIAADISAEAARLYDVVEDLLVLTRAEQGILELAEDPVHLKRVAESVIRVATSRLPSVPVVFAGVADPPAVHGDAVYVEQVIRNLVTAGSRFASPDSPVVVRIDATDEECSVSVIDHGPPLSDNEIETAFDILHESAGPRRTSAGIGLFVCRRLVEAMKGRIWIKRPSGGGSAEYGFALPRYAVLD
jgi:K+-sensing histidine kinase KdpD